MEEKLITMDPASLDTRQPVEPQLDISKRTAQIQRTRQYNVSLLLLPIQVLNDGIHYEVVDRTICLLSQFDQSFNWLQINLALRNVDRQLVQNLFLGHIIHPLPNRITASIRTAARVVKCGQDSN